ncbi:ABC transporter substrate-binding protein [Herbaspirillum huttiense]|uniref:ABC transporter substrate-binding protein n=1 Tax=Herbaspirillum huttiense TaxID=863372 RepID=UPI0010659070|nr:ABC transporter substrate-binding protein [Herbaspirillum huttiense]QBP77684.1 ABC transporter substrate-binding protein [Herbaspirillum huttiense]
MKKTGQQDLALNRDRRSVIRASAGALLAMGITASGFSRVAFADSGRTIKIGYVTPKTGPLAGFGEVDKFVLDNIAGLLKAGVVINGKSHPVEVIVKDSQSNPNRAAEVAAELILKNKIDLMIVGSTPENANPVSDQCELNGVPCISTTTPWQPWFFTRGGKPGKGFDWTYHFFWGLEDIIAVFTNMWKDVPTNKVVGLLLANDGDGNAWGDSTLGLPPVLKKKGYTIVDPGRYQSGQTDFSAQISMFKKAGVEIVAGVPTPPDFKNFWVQAQQQGFHPKVVSVGKALAFPASVDALGNSAGGLSQELWWSPNRPFKSSLTGVTAQQFARAYESESKKQWTQPLGYAHALFEVAIDVLKRTKNIDSKSAIRDAVLGTKLETIIGHVEWGNGPVKNVAKTPLVSGQWVKSTAHRYELIVVNNETAPEIPVQSKIKPIP